MGQNLQRSKIKTKKLSQQPLTPKRVCRIFKSVQVTFLFIIIEGTAWYPLHQAKIACSLVTVHAKPAFLI